MPVSSEVRADWKVGDCDSMGDGQPIEFPLPMASAPVPSESLGANWDADDSDSMAEGEPIESANWDIDDNDSMAGGEAIESPPAVPPGHGRTGGGKPNGPSWKKHRAILLAEDGYPPVFLGLQCLADIVVPGAHVFDVGVTEADLSDHMTIIQAKDLDVDGLPESVAEHLEEVRLARTTWPVRSSSSELFSALHEALDVSMPDDWRLRWPFRNHSVMEAFLPTLKDWLQTLDATHAPQQFADMMFACLLVQARAIAEKEVCCLLSLRVMNAVQETHRDSLAFGGMPTAARQQLRACRQHSFAWLGLVGLDSVFDKLCVGIPHSI